LLNIYFSHFDKQYFTNCNNDISSLQIQPPKRPTTGEDDDDDDEWKCAKKPKELIKTPHHPCQRQSKELET
jgi:hypothetical protein